MKPEEINYFGQQLSSFISLQATLIAIKANHMQYVALKEEQSLLPMLDTLLSAVYLSLISSIIELSLALYEHELIHKDPSTSEVLKQANKTLITAQTTSITSSIIKIKAIHLYIEVSKERPLTTTPEVGVGI